MYIIFWCVLYIILYIPNISASEHRNHKYCCNTYAVIIWMPFTQMICHYTGFLCFRKEWYLHLHSRNEEVCSTLPHWSRRHCTATHCCYRDNRHHRYLQFPGLWCCHVFSVGSQGPQCCAHIPTRYILYWCTKLCVATTPPTHRSIKAWVLLLHVFGDNMVHLLEKLKWPILFAICFISL